LESRGNITAKLIVVLRVFRTEPYDSGFRLPVMDNPRALRRKAAQYFESAASAPISEKAEKLREVGRQLELWADDLEEVETRGQNLSHG
jgi:hypothetical protein